MKLRDRIGDKYGLLSVTSLYGSKITGGKKRIFWNCRCDCGNDFIAEGGRLNSGYTKSCGCLRNETIGNLNRTHSDSKSKEYKAWCKLKSRCFCKTDKKYYAYGGRGITVCDHWINSYENFLTDMGRAPSNKHSVDRIRVNGNYEPGNCRWATSSEQANNMRQTIRVNLYGSMVSMKQWSDYYELNYKSVHSLRKYKGMSFNEILIHYGKL